MNEPNWIDIGVLIATQKELIAEHGGIEGIRDYNLLESACTAPQQLYYYSNPKPSIPELAARYAYSITRNHPFNDSNKRSAAVACELFLELNDFSFTASDEEAYFAFVDLAAGNLKEEDFIKWLKETALSCVKK